MNNQHLFKVFGLVTLTGCLSNFFTWAGVSFPAQSATKPLAVVHASLQLAQKTFRQVRFVEVRAIAPTLLKQKSNEAANYDNTLRAYTIPGVETAEQIVIEDLNTHQLYILEGFPPSPRAFSRLVWVNTNILSAERWSNPHYGFRYEIDVKQHQLVREDNIAS